MFRRFWNRNATTKSAATLLLRSSKEQAKSPPLRSIAKPPKTSNIYAISTTTPKDATNVKFSRVAPFALQPRVIIYDGVCHLCNAGVQWIIKVDTSESISFCALQSEAAEPYLIACGVSREEVLRRFIFVEGPGYCHSASTAALKVASYLPLPYSALSVLLVIPAPIRDVVYDYIAKNRYKWFGREDECIVPSDDILHRFIDKDELLEIREKSQDNDDDDHEQVG